MVRETQFLPGGVFACVLVVKESLISNCVCVWLCGCLVSLWVASCGPPEGTVSTDWGKLECYKQKPAGFALAAV